MERKEKLIQAIRQELKKSKTISDTKLDKDETRAECEGNDTEKESCAFSQSVRWDLCCAATLGLTLLLYIIIGGIAFEALALPARVKDVKDTKLRREEFLDALAVLMAQDNGSMSIDTATAENRAKVVTLMNKLCKSGTFHQQTKRLWTHDGAFLLLTSVITTIGFSRMHPSTAEGQLALIVFALIGIPLSTLFLIATGRLLKQMVQWGCCQRGSGPSTRTIAFLSSFFVFVLGMSTFILVPALVLSQVENWAYFEAFYYTFMTLTTIGTVKIIPGWKLQRDHASQTWDIIYKLFLALWIFTGLAYVSLLIQSVRDCERQVHCGLRRQWNRGLMWMKQHRATKKQQKDNVKEDGE